MTSAIEIGDAVRASVGAGLFVHGEVQELRGEECRVRGRWVPLSGVKTEEQIEDEKHEIIRENYRQRAAEQAAKLAAETALKSAPKVPLVLSQKKELTFDERCDFISHLLSTGYRLHVAAREDGIEQAREEYSSWTDGESLSEDCVYMNDTAFTTREWFLEFYYDENISYPFPIIEMGTVGRGSKSEPRALHHGGKVTACYAEIAEFAVRSGIRARNERI